MAENKTKATSAKVEDFISGIADAGQRADAQALVKLMQQVTRQQPKMWGPSIIGFGSYHYKYASGREGDMPLTAFSPRKAALTLYLGGLDAKADLLDRLGKYKTGKGCLYVKRLADVDMTVLKELVKVSNEHRKASHED